MSSLTFRAFYDFFGSKTNGEIYARNDTFCIHGWIGTSMGPQYYISDILARLMLRERNALIRYQQQDRIEFRMHIEPGLITMRTWAVASSHCYTLELSTEMFFEMPCIDVVRILTWLMVKFIVPNLTWDASQYEMVIGQVPSCLPSAIGNTDWPHGRVSPAHRWRWLHHIFSLVSHSYLIRSKLCLT